MIVIVDIDGTLCDIEPRLKLAGKQPSRKDKKAFQMWLDRLQQPKVLAKDKPIAEVITTIQILAKSPDVKIIYLTGRSSKYKKVTKTWLKKMKCPKGPLSMRPLNDFRSSSDYKESVMIPIVQANSNQSVLIFDDDGDGCCSKMYKKHGWKHLRVMWNIIDKPRSR